MTKFFKAKIVLQQIVMTNVAAETEEEAKRRAQASALATIGAQAAQVVGVEITPDGETEYAVGMRVKHALFGSGQITGLRRTTNGLGEVGFAASIKFDRGDTKGIALSLPKGKLEVLSEA